MAYETYKESTKYTLELLFETVEDAGEWISCADEEVCSGQHKDHAEDWVEMYFDSEDDLKSYVTLAITWKTCRHFEVYKH